MIRSTFLLMAILALALVSPSKAFVTRTTCVLPVISTGAVDLRKAPTSTAAAVGPLFVKKNKVSEKSTGGTTDPLKLISPANPYMWFVYMIGFIYAADFFKTM
jgi:hypothetical protein